MVVLLTLTVGALWVCSFILLRTTGALYYEERIANCHRGVGGGPRRTVVLVDENGDSATTFWILGMIDVAFFDPIVERLSADDLSCG